MSREKLPLNDLLDLGVSFTGTALSKACWDVLSITSQIEFVAALESQNGAPADGSAIIKRELSIATRSRSTKA
jgi:hypothetical protein